MRGVLGVLTPPGSEQPVLLLPSAPAVGSSAPPAWAHGEGLQCWRWEGSVCCHALRVGGASTGAV